MPAFPLPHRVGPKVDVPEVPYHALLLQLFNAHIQADPERVAFIHHDAPELPNVTFKQLVQRSLSLARFVQNERLVWRADIAAISLPSSWLYTAAAIGIPANGAALSGFSYRATPDESLHQLQDSEAVLLITTVENYHRLASIYDKLPHLKSFLFVHSAKSPRNVRPLRPHHRLFDLDRAIADTPPQFDFISVKIAPKSDLYILPYSSGTTGKPKGVMITHFNYVAMLMAMKTHAENEFMPVLLKYDDFTTPDHVVLMLPLYHAMGFFSLNANLSRGNTVVIIQNYSDEKTFSAIQRYRPRGLTMIPALYNRFMHSAQIHKFDLSSILSVGSGGSTLSGEISAQFTRRFKSVKLVTQGYGMTEMTTAAFSTSKRAVSGSIGIALPNIEYRIVKDDGREAGTNEEGELWLRGPNVMKGYWKNSKATAETIVEDGWLRTGDLVREDENRQLFVVGRLKELIKVNAFQVPPTELEELIAELPEVVDCAVIGVPDAESGELPRAFVVRRPGAALTAAAVQRHVAERVSAYKRLRGGVEFVAEIPRSEAGKIARRQLLADYLKRTAGRKEKSRL